MKDMGDAKPRKYGPPKVPVTPSGAINSMLQQRCGKAFSNPVKAVAARYICFVFYAITVVYSYIYTRKDKPSHTYWMVSCALVSVGLLVKTYLLYHMIVISAIVLHSLLYYASFLLAFGAIGLGVSGILFFDKDTVKGNSTAFRSQSSLVTEGGSFQAHGAGDGQKKE